MTEPWKALEAMGLPTGGPRPRPEGPLQPRAVRAAIEAIAAGGRIEPDLCEPLLAWLSAWRHHWPSSFRDVLGASGPEIVARLEGQGVDADRYLKLRRIAVENLAGVL